MLFNWSEHSSEFFLIKSWLLLDVFASVADDSRLKSWTAREIGMKEGVWGWESKTWFRNWLEHLQQCDIKRSKTKTCLWFVGRPYKLFEASWTSHILNNVLAANVITSKNKKQKYWNKSGLVAGRQTLTSICFGWKSFFQDWESPVANTNCRCVLINSLVYC